MSVHNGPNVIENGLVLCLDAGDPRSYAGSGTVWADRSGLGNNGTLVNGVGYNSSNRGSLVFDGIDDQVNCTNSPLSAGKVTASAWIRLGSSTSNQHIIDSGSNTWHLAIIGSSLNPYFYNGSTFHSSSVTLLRGVWYMLTGIQGTTNDIYVNGVRVATLSSNVNITTNAIALGTWQSGGGRFLNGNVAQALVYNRALSADEIKQNFEATRSRFAI